MHSLLHKHGCANVFTVPEGLKELMSDITREVLREQPLDILDFIANYLSILLITREHGILAVKILDDLCDCKPSVSEHLLLLGLEKNQAEVLSQTIKQEIEGFEPVEGKETVKEIDILKKILKLTKLDEEMTAKVCQIVRNAYRDYWYRKKLLEKNLETHPSEPWEIAAEHTLELYKRTKPSFSELTRAAEKIQAAYRGYHIRRKLFRYLKPKQKKRGPKVALLGTPLDIAKSREIDLGPLICICNEDRVKEDDVAGMFDELMGKKIALKYDPDVSRAGDDANVKYIELCATKAGRVIEKFEPTSTRASLSLEQKRRQADEMVRQIRLTNKSETAHESLVAMPEPERQSRLLTQMSKSKQSQLAVPDENIHKISFSTAKVMSQVIRESVETLLESSDDVEVDEVITEDQPKEAEAEPAQEIPEDIAADDNTASDGESAPIASVSTTAEIANDSEVEDIDEDMATTEDEQ